MANIEKIAKDIMGEFKRDCKCRYQIGPDLAHANLLAKEVLRLREALDKIDVIIHKISSQNYPDRKYKWEIIEIVHQSLGQIQEKN